MSERLDVDICVIGAGSGGLSVAAGASQLGQKVVLCERARMGGDCLNFGCVPSKSVIAAARAATAIREAGRFGVRAESPTVDYAALREHVRGVIAAIEPNDSVERFTGLGVRVVQDHAAFTGPDEVKAGGFTIRARRFVVATGSAASVPPIPGLDGVPFLTNETVFDLAASPEHLIVIGGGPIGCELAQAHRRLGARVTVIEALPSVLSKDDPELADFVKRRMRRDGVEILEGAKVLRVEGRAGDLAVIVDKGGAGHRIAGSHLLVATGRRATVDGLNLDAAGVKHSPKGIEVDAHLRTSNRRIYAIGDVVAGGHQFTHVAGYHAGIVIRNALFRLPAKVDYRALPRVTFTAPELANVGMTEAEAQASGETLRILRWPFHENDRAQAERETEGLIKVIATTRGRVLGAGIVGPHAGELIQLWGLVIAKRLKLGDVASLMLPYPTLSEVSKRAAGSFFAPKLFAPFTRKLVRFLAKFG
jgi:pyruvate/2-oxoglutarate dehydrogenase complex dihydrolipoamide dehydrogenase (E3) component